MPQLHGGLRIVLTQPVLELHRIWGTIAPVQSESTGLKSLFPKRKLFG